MLTAPIRCMSSRVRRSREEDLAGAFCPVSARYAEPQPASNLTRRRRSAVNGVLATGDRQVTHDVQRMTSAGRPAVDHGDDDLGHRADETLDLEDVEPPTLCLNPSSVNGFRGLAVGVLIAAAPPDPLVPAGQKPSRRPSCSGRYRSAGRCRRPATCERGPTRDTARRRCVAEGVAHLRAIEGDADGALGEARPESTVRW